MGERKQMIENSDRGLTINKSLAWTILSALVGAGIYFGIQTGTTASAIEDLKDEVTTATGKRDGLEVRVRALEIGESARAMAISHMTKTMNEIQIAQKENNRLLRELIRQTE